MLRALAASFSFSLVLLLSACGDGDSAPAMGGGQPAASTTVSSNVVKGIIKNGVVKARRWQDGAYVEVASARTNAAGEFSLTVTNAVPGEVLRLDLELSSDTSPGQRTEMLCDVAQCGSALRGEWTPLTTGLGLSSWVSVAADGSLTVMPMTPVSTLLVRYAESLGSGHMDATSLAAARLRVAALFQMNADELLTRPGNIVDGVWLDAASDNAVKLSLLSAAFAELALNSGTAVEDVIDTYAGAFADFNGHLMQDGAAASLGDLYRGMATIIAAAGSPAVQSRVTAWIDGFLAGLQSGQLNTSACAPDCAPFDSNRLVTALGTTADSLGGDLSRVMQENNVSTLEALLAKELAQFGWLASADTVAVAGVAVQVVGMGVMTAVGMPPAPMNGLTPVVNGNMLTVTGEQNGLQVDLQVELAPLLDFIQNYQSGAPAVFVFGAHGTLQNERMRASIDGNLTIDATATNFLPLKTALTSFITAQLNGNASASATAMQSLLKALAGILRNGEATFTLNGSAGIAKLEVPDGVPVETSRLAVEGKAWLHVDMNGGSNGAIAANGAVEYGSITLPNGDHFAVDPELGHQLQFALATDGTFGASFAASVLSHAAAVTGEGRLAGLGTLLTNLRNSVAGGLETLNLDLNGVLSQLLADFQDLALSVNGQAVIADFGHTYTLTLAEGRMRISQPNSTATALEVVFSRHGLLAKAGAEWWFVSLNFDGTGKLALTLSDSSGGEWPLEFDFSGLLVASS